MSVEPVIVVSDGWILDALAADRLAHQLRCAPSAVQGIVATAGSLPPGSSYRVHAERQALLPFAAVSPASEASVRGAVALRPEVDHSIRDGHILVDTSPDALLVDRGAYVHDPTGAAFPPGIATIDSRPPFPWRPVVAFVAAGDREAADPELGEWARSLVNALLDHDVEGRLVMDDRPDGPHLTAVCTPGDESIAALRPDVIVPLDGAARASIGRWASLDPSLLVVDLADDPESPIELVSWKVGGASGPLRARVGRQVDAASLAQVVERLCAGPHPAALTEQADESIARGQWRDGLDTLVSVIRTPNRPSAPATRSVAALTGSAHGSSDHLEGLLDHLDAAGHVCDLHHVRNGWPPELDGADLVVLQSVAAADAGAFVQRRRAAGRPTIIDVSLDDDDGLELAALTGLAISSSETVAAQLNARGVRVQVLPTLLTRVRDAELRSLRKEQAAPDHVLGLRLDGGTVVDDPVVQAVVKAVNQIFEDDHDLELLVVDGLSELPDLAAEVGDRVRVSSDPVAVSELGRCLGQVWIATRADADSRTLLEAGHMGLPTVLAAGNHAALVSRHPAELLVDRPSDSDAWIEAIRPLVTEPGTRARLGREIVRHSDPLHGVAASSAVVSRFLGWIDRVRLDRPGSAGGSADD